VHATYQDLIADPELDVIYNPLPNSLHCDMVDCCAARGKHVLCEKPLASNALEAERMARAAEETGKILGEAFHYRYHPLAEPRACSHQRRDDRPADPCRGHFSVPIPETNIRFDWSLAGGATMDLGCYPLHMIRYFSGVTPRVISATAETGPKNIRYRNGGGTRARRRSDGQDDLRDEEGFCNWCDVHGARRAGGTPRHQSNRAASGHQLTLKTSGGEKSETVPGRIRRSRISARLCEGRCAVDAKFPTDGAEGVINMRVIDEVYRAAGLPPSRYLAFTQYCAAAAIYDCEACTA